MNAQLWHRPATIERNHFKFKSLSCWAYNVAVGCGHACRFCYVPAVTGKGATAAAMKKLGVQDPDAEWGEYVFPRKWDKGAFMASLRAAEQTPAHELNADGNRAVMLCTTTDPYQTIGHGAGEAAQQHRPTLQAQLDSLVREALVLMCWGPMNGSHPLNVRILTRSPLARRDFPLMKQFGKRLLFGMSIPTLNNKLAKIYEPRAPSPSQRLKTLKLAREAGLNVFVAVAPAYPECDAEDMRRTLQAVMELEPVTVFMEPINVRAENVARIAAAWEENGAGDTPALPENHEAWKGYALKQLFQFERVAYDLGVPDNVLHLWPDPGLCTKQTPPDIRNWLHKQWSKISRWPA
jgi:DNA repair photolyase